MFRRIAAVAFAALLCTVPVAASAAETAQTVVLVVDTSGSMQGERLKAAIDASHRFLDIVPADDPVALVTFAKTATVLVKPTTDHAAIGKAVDALRAGGDTALFDGVRKAVVLASGAPSCTVLLLADGEDTSSKATKAQAVATLERGGCSVNAVALRATDKTLATLKALAAAGGGTAYTAFDAEGIAAVFVQAIESPTPTPTTESPTPTPTTQSPSPTPTPTPTPEPFTLPTSILLALALVMASGLFSLVYLVTDGSTRSDRRRMNRLIEAYAVQRPDQGTDEQQSFVETLEDAISPLLARGGKAEQLAIRLDGAAVNRTPEQWILIRIGATLGVALVASLIARSPVAGVVLGIGLGGFGPDAWLNRRRSKRGKRFEEGLPDALMLMASSLRSGFALDQAIVSAAEQSDSEVATELKRAVQEIRIGVSLEDALERAANRINSADFHWVVTALRIQRRSGGNLAELLVTVSKTVRQRAELSREVKALTAEGRMSAYVLMALPIGLFAFLLLTQASYLAPMWSTSMGWILSGVAVGMLGIGWLLMQRMIKVDV